MLLKKDTPILMIDTETTGELDCPFVYDVGYQIFTLADGVLVEKSFVNREIFTDNEMMKAAYFAEKVPSYWQDIWNGKRKMRIWNKIKNAVYEDCKKYGVHFACAHNASFDNRSLNTTQRYLTCSKWRYFLPYGMEWLDTLKMARAILKDNENYTTFCRNNGFLTQNGRIRYTAEIIFKWLSQNIDFAESHTGLEDVEIERQIFEYLYNENPGFDGRLWVK